MVCFSVSLGDFGATKIHGRRGRSGGCRIDYPGYSRSGRLVILSPESDHAIGETSRSNLYRV